MNETNNSFPIKEIKEAKEKAEKTEKRKANKPLRGRIDVLNIGQLLFLAFLFTLLLIQSINIYTEDSADTDDSGISEAAENINFSPYSPEYSDGENNAVENISPKQNTADSGAIFILGECEGKLAVLSPDKKVVYEVFDVYINTLPEYDKDLLYEGIKVKSTEELNSLLEDYSS
jgi:hypothetical protein